MKPRDKYGENSVYPDCLTHALFFREQLHRHQIVEMTGIILTYLSVVFVSRVSPPPLAAQPQSRSGAAAGSVVGSSSGTTYTAGNDGELLRFEIDFYTMH